MAFSHRPSYALPALKKYLSHISLPAPHQNTLLQNATREQWATSSEARDVLKQLQVYQQAKIPFSNLYLHYSRHHVGTLKPAELFEYLVLSRGIASEGGSGESSILAAGKGVLAGVSKESESEGARVAATVLGGERYRFCGWNHLINLVEFEGKRWLVDVGFGGDGPACPIELVDGKEVSWGATGNTLRLIYAPIQEFEDPNQRCWILQHRQAGKSEWDDVYCFTETEFLPQDIAVMNFKTTGDVRTSFFNHVAFCGSNVVEEGEVIGKVNLAGGKCKRTVWRRGKWEKEVLGTCESEVERWEILERVFGIVLGNEERKGISGMVSELRRKPKDD
ncbi:hypothetical protein LZ554_006974 [Drepanopeziza brunnea f. sp. 'monogermtubi']|nr:hypothetical protein LZ554_006974 [Drepanopeziza brunnea f. sp. 'monogermtubi']